MKLSELYNPELKLKFLNQRKTETQLFLKSRMHQQRPPSKPQSPQMPRNIPTPTQSMPTLMDLIIG